MKKFVEIVLKILFICGFIATIGGFGGIERGTATVLQGLLCSIIGATVSFISAKLLSYMW